MNCSCLLNPGLSTSYWTGPLFLKTLFPFSYGYYFLSLPIFITFSSFFSICCCIFHFEMNSYGVRYRSAECVFCSCCSLQMHFLLWILLPGSSENHLTIYTLSLVSCGMIQCVRSVMVYCNRYVPVSNQVLIWIF